MKTFVLCCVVLCVFQLCSADPDGRSRDPKRARGNSLTPMLRVGRRSDSAWESNFELRRKLDALSYPSRLARRSWQAYAPDKRTNTNSGMWFGPRLGRLQKRNIDEDYTPWTYIILNGEGPVSRQVHYTPRLGREPEDFMDEMNTGAETAA